ncbi:ATP-binding protein, partial [Kamptonema sp. PCC 6506]|uniref:ATP-binding protein n=1 Tax=Kamptonema sp. PCC 6506 TaxID=272129 RepID=UPI0005875847
PNPRTEGATGGWQCDIAQVKALAITDDVVEFMALQLQKLPTETQNILKLAACIGAQFDLNTLAIVSEQSKEDAATALWQSLQFGLIIPKEEIYKFFTQSDTASVSQVAANPTYRFLHDRVQQAAYSLIPDDQKKKTHWTIGQLLKQQISQEELESSIFDLIGHLNMGVESIEQPQQCLELAQLNLIAGRKAKAVSALDAAAKYYHQGIALVEEGIWQTDYDLALGLYELATEVAAMQGDFAQMEQWAAVAISQATITDCIKVQSARIQAYATGNQFDRALTVAIQALTDLGFHLPTQASEAEIGEALQATMTLVAQQPIASLADLPVMQDLTQLATMEILAALLSVTYTSAPTLYPLVVMEQVRRSIQLGNAPSSAFAYVTYGVLVNCLLQDVEQASQLGEVAQRLSDRSNSQDLKAKVYTCVGGVLFHLKHPLKNSLSILLEAHQAGLASGSFEYVGYSGYMYASHHYLSGESLTVTEEIAAEFYRRLRQLNLTTTTNYCGIIHQAVLYWLGQRSQRGEQGEYILLEADLRSQMEAQKNGAGLVILFVNQLMLCYGFGRFDRAMTAAQQFKLWLPAASGTIMEPLFYFYDSLIALAIYPQTAIAQQPQLLEQIANNQQPLKLLADRAPMNFLHKYQLVEAEKCRVLGKNYEAGDWYDRAIAGAKANGYIQEEALANELAAKFYLDWGKEKVAVGYMQEAYYCYAKWGAKAKVADLEQRYTDLLRPILQQAALTLNPLETLATLANPALSLHSSSQTNHSSSSSINTALDFAAIIKASQALSSTIQLDELLHQLTQIILQNSGGSLCALILPNTDGQWQVRAIATPEATELCTQPIEGNINCPLKLIQYVKNTQEIVVIDDIKTDLPVIDEYLNRQQPQSVLCLPILNQGHLIGILYLENRTTRGVFISDRILILNFLCTQAAISLENARLYQQSQDWAQQLEQSQLQLVQSEKMSALGNLVAGVAHEINNPVGCIVGNVGAAQDYINDLLGLIDLYGEKFPQPGAEIEEELEAIDLEYVREDLPKLIKAMKDGGDRITSISKSLRTFSRADSDRKQIFDLHEGIDSTILILRHRLKANDNRPAIEVATNYGIIPAINCFPGQLNQVFMNILANAIDALDESNIGRSFAEIKANPNRIKIATFVENQEVKITITDNGKGMNESVIQKIFDHLFTTKVVGKGTGLGLAIARQIVIEKHGGSIHVNSTLGQGTEFIITLPIKGE